MLFDASSETVQFQIKLQEKASVASYREWQNLVCWKSHMKSHFTWQLLPLASVTGKQKVIFFSFLLDEAIIFLQIFCSRQDPPRQFAILTLNFFFFRLYDIDFL